MSVRTVSPQIRHRWVLDVEAVKSNREEDDEKIIDFLQQTSCCLACNHVYDSLLILPCSHTMCAPCIAAREAVKSSKPHQHLQICSVFCPSCRHPVELPCWNWSSAVSCLPTYPSLTPAGVIREAASEDQHQQENRRCLDTGHMAVQSSLRGSSASTSIQPPVDGGVDLNEEEMEKSVLGLCFALDPATVPPSLHLSNSFLTITCQGEIPPGPPPDDKVRSSRYSDLEFTPPESVCGDVIIARGQYYWEVDVCNSSVYRIGVRSVDGSGGCWFQRRGLSFSAVYDGVEELLCTVPPQIKTVGVFLNIGGCTLSFHNPLTQEHLATLPTRFGPAGVLPALNLGQGHLRLRSGLPAPLHIFLSKDSAYRRPPGIGAGRWRREIPFQSVRKVIQKFEELAASDSDSGFLSSFASSCSTSASIPDLHWMG